ncbi:MAG: prepilin-type N-terminal cleavage/methylation domain-containing protein [Candidatus Nomurabacteria bacterium]|nr:MAG: prepilin-type N-terminal cleavage/methylation domain-containing protein [Candidatus Nomurabacteria bacterium]
MQNGFTLIELLVTLLLMTLLALWSFSSLKEYRDLQIARSNALEISSLIKEARQKTLSAETDTQFGVHVATSSITVFEGASYNPSDPNNLTFTFLRTNLLTQLSDSSSDIMFARLTGVPSATGTIAVGDTALNSTTTITIQEAGLVE